MNLVLTPDKIVIEGDRLADYVKKQVEKKIGSKVDSLIEDYNQKVQWIERSTSEQKCVHNLGGMILKKILVLQSLKLNH